VYRTYDYLCDDCGHRSSGLQVRDEQPDTLPCPECEGISRETIGAPAPLRHSHHDGYRRGGDYQLIKEASKLETTMYNLPHEKRGEHKKKIKELKQRATREKGK
jgi:putative FmdB family regulatory protein